MKFIEILTVKLTGIIMLTGLILLKLFHVLVMLKLLPSNIVWGGQVGDSESNLLMMEGVSLIVTLLIMAIVVIRLRYFNSGKLKIVSSIGIWVVFVLFVLSTIGNLSSNVSAEKLIFTPLSVILALLALRLAVAK